MLNLKTKSKEINLVYRTKKLVDVTNILKGTNFDELYFKAASENNLDALSKIIYVFAEKPEDGTQAFKESDDVYDFLDDYMEENKKTYQDIFDMLAQSINDEGFFRQKIKEKKELLEKTKYNPLSSLDMNSIVKSSAEQAIGKMAENQIFQGYKG